MEVKITIDPTAKEPCIEIRTAVITEELSALATRLSESGSTLIAGFLDTQIIPISPIEIVRIFTEGTRVFAETTDLCVVLKYRLYELEMLLHEPFFLRISHSEIVNFKQVKSMDMSMAGTISLLLTNGKKSYVSRRCVAKIKSFLGL